MLLEQIEKLNAERTQGDWWAQEFGEKNNFAVMAQSKGPTSETDGWQVVSSFFVNGKMTLENANFIAASPQMANMLLKLKKMDEEKLPDKILQKVSSELGRFMAEMGEDQDISDTTLLVIAEIVVSGICEELEGDD